MQRSAVRTLRLLAMLAAAVALLIPATAAAHSHGKRHQQRHHSKHHARDHGNQAAPNALYTTTNSSLPSGVMLVEPEESTIGNPNGGSDAAPLPPVATGDPV